MTEKEIEVFERMRNNIPNDYEKNTPGFLTYDITKANAIEVSKLYEAVEKLALKLDVENLVGEELTREARTRRGIIRKEATRAKVELVAKGQGNIKIGDLFSTQGKIHFIAIEDVFIVEEGTVKAESVEPGIIGNVGANTITQFPITIAGITEINNPNPSYEGFEKETDESLLERYLDDVRRPINSNNIYHFEKWAREVPGVGRARILPTWQGNNSVKVLIINDNMLPASVDLVGQVQEYIDPIDPQKWGKGYGQSALGSYCTVASAIGILCNINAEIIIGSNFEMIEIKERVEEGIINHFKEIAFDDIINYVSYAKISAIIVNTEGVLDVNDVLINNARQNIILEADEVATLGTVVLT